MWQSPGKNIEREILEEAGLTVRAIKIAAVYDRKTQGHTQELFNSYKLFFICEYISGELTPSMETSELKFFAEEEIPEEDRALLSAG
jgi:ADP-ribose pyrophosphatase YjhB (NUDIX family)